MKQADFSNIGLGIGQSPSFPQQLQLGMIERFASLIQSIAGVTNEVVIITGLELTDNGSNVSVTAGVVFYNGEMYSVDAINEAKQAGTVVVFSTPTKEYYQKAWHGDKTQKDTFFHNKLIVEQAAAGSGVGDFENAKVIIDLETRDQNLKDEILGGAGAAYDTLRELQDELQDNDNAIVAINSLIATKVGLSGNENVGGVKTFTATPILNTGIIQIGSTAGTKVFIRFDGKISSDGTTWVDIAKATDFFNGENEALTILGVTGADANGTENLPTLNFTDEEGNITRVPAIVKNENPTGRGTYMDWNKYGGGRTDFINHGEGGSGGFVFWSKNNADGTSEPVPLVFINENGEMFIDPDGNNYTNIHSGNIGVFTGEAPGDIKQVRESDLPITGWKRLVGTELQTFVEGNTDVLNYEDSEFLPGNNWNMVPGSGSNTAEISGTGSLSNSRLRLIANVNSPNPYGELLITLNSQDTHELNFDVDYHFGTNLPHTKIYLRRQSDNSITTIINDIDDGFTGLVSQTFNPPSAGNYYLTVELDKTNDTDAGQVRLESIQILEGTNIVSIIKE